MAAAPYFKKVRPASAWPDAQSVPNRAHMINQPQNYSTTMRNPEARYLREVFVFPTSEPIGAPKFISAALVR